MLCEADLKICLPKIHYPSSCHRNDITIIEKALSLKIFNKTELYHFNILWVHLQIIFVLDLLQPNTNKIKLCFWTGSWDQSISTKYKWPSVIPAPIAITLFKRFLYTISTHNHLLSPIQWKELSYHTSTINNDHWFQKYVKFYDI